VGEEAADEIERAWAARDAAVADLEAHAEAEVRRAVAAERERWHDAIQAAMPQHERFDDQRGAANALRAVLSACRPNAEPTGLGRSPAEITEESTPAKVRLSDS
jgi:hypothetical protein